MWLRRQKSPKSRKRNACDRRRAVEHRASRHRAARTRRSTLQSLEDRRLLIATISVSTEAPVAIPEAPLQRIVYSLTRDETDDLLAVKFELSGDALYDVDYTTDEGENDTVFLPAEAPTTGPVTGTATFYPGESTVEIIVEPIRDSLIERDEDIVVTIVEADEFGPVNGAAALIVDGQETVYHVVDDNNRLATVDIETGCVHVIGTIPATQIINDIAFTANGDLLAITNDNLYEVDLDPVSGEVVSSNFLGFHGIWNANALVDSRNGDFGSNDGDLFAVGATFLDLQLIDLETVGGQIVMNNVTTVFDIDGTLASQLMPSNFSSSGDLDYLSAGHLILSATRPGDDFDSLIEIRTPGTAGVIENEPKPAQDPGEPFTEIYGLAFDDNQNYGFAGYTMLIVNQFSRDSSRVLELTGRPYEIDTMSSATGTIIGDPVDPPVVTLASLRSDPDDLAHGPQPTSWSQQRSDLRDIVIDLGAAIESIPADGIVLTNLGVTGSETPAEVNLRNDQVVLAATGNRITIQLDEAQLADGRYQLVLSPDVTTGPEFTYVGDRTNRFFVLRGDWNGNARVDLLDFATFAYWFGNSTTVAPNYVDLNGSGTIDFGDFTLFENNYADTIALPGAPDPITPDLIDDAELQRALQSLLNPLDVNGNTQVSPLDALSVLNRILRGFPTATDWRYDVNRDGNISPLDALIVLNEVARQLTPQSTPIVHDSPAILSLDNDDDDRWNTHAIDEVLSTSIWRPF